MNPRGVFEILKETISEWQKDKASRLAAALAYYTAFSLGPLLLVAISIAGFVFGEAAARGEIVSQIEGAVGPEAAGAIQTVLGAANEPGAGIVATVIGVVTLLLAASGIVNSIKDALNTVWEVRPEGGGIVGMVKDRVLAFAMVVGVGILLLLLLFSSAAIATVANLFAEVLPGALSGWALQGINFLVSFAILTLVFAVIYKVLPDAEIAWSNVIPGAAFTAFLFAIGQLAIGLYIGYAGVGSAYGAAGSLVVLLVWIYYSAQIFLLGAEFTQVYARRRGLRIQPSANAVRVTADERAQQGLAAKGTREEQAPEAPPAPVKEKETPPAEVEPADWQRRRLSPVGTVVFIASMVVGVVGAAINAIRGGREPAGG